MRQYRPLLGALAAACLLAPLVPLSPTSATTSAALGSTTSTTSEVATTSGSFMVATYNIRHKLADSVAVSDIKKLAAAGADIISMQEMGSARRRDAVRARLVSCDGCAFGAAMPNGAGPGEIPILFRRSELQYLSKGIQKVSDATYVGPSGAGPSTIAPKYLNYIQLRHRRTGKVVYVINNHTVASVQASDGGPNYKHPERLQLYRQHMDGLRGMIARFSETGALVIATGDFNVNYRRDSVRQDDIFPYANMKRVDMFASYKTLGMPAIGTHVNRNGNDTRLIDYVAATREPAVAPTRQKILTGYESDHRPVLVTYGISTAPGSPTGVTAEPLERAARVSWTAAPDNGAPVSRYTVTAVQDGTQVTVPGDATTATVPGLTAGQRYTFQVRATNRIGTGPASTESAAVTPYAVAPRTTITGGPRDGAFVTRDSALMKYVSDTAGSTFTCLLDGQSQSCGAGSVELTALSQRTHEFSVAAKDREGDVDATPATRSWTVPLDSRDLTRTARWTLRYGSAYYTGAFVETTRRGAELTRQVTDASSLALVATAGPGHGTVRVYLGTTLLKRLPLESAVLHRRRVLRVADFAEPVSGTVRVVVGSADKTVRVEGLGVARP